MRTRRYSIGAALLAATLLAACEAPGVRGVARTPAPAPPPPAAQAPPSVAAAPAPRALGAMRAGDLIGRSVYNRAGERVGAVDEVVMHRRDRTIGVVLGVGGFLGIGESHAVVPVRQLRIQGERLVAPNLTRETVEAVANYRPRDWERVDDAQPVGAGAR